MSFGLIRWSHKSKTIEPSTSIRFYQNQTKILCPVNQKFYNGRVLLKCDDRNYLENITLDDRDTPIIQNIGQDLMMQIDDLKKKLLAKEQEFKEIDKESNVLRQKLLEKNEECEDIKKKLDQKSLEVDDATQKNDGTGGGDENIKKDEIIKQLNDQIEDIRHDLIRKTKQANALQKELFVKNRDVDTKKKKLNYQQIDDNDIQSEKNENVDTKKKKIKLPTNVTNNENDMSVDGDKNNNVLNHNCDDSDDNDIQSEKNENVDTQKIKIKLPTNVTNNENDMSSDNDVDNVVLDDSDDTYDFHDNDTSNNIINDSSKKTNKWNQDGAGCSLLVPGHSVYITTSQLQSIEKKKKNSKPKKIITTLMKSIIGQKKLKKMTPSGKGKNKIPIPEDVIHAVDTFVKNEGYSLSRKAMTECLSRMCKGLRENEKKINK
ncbi:hypothetical protein HCN44_000826 [Aphidius gifuensis]|uniref:BEN domain-containing protein n=1 Tax=Aphidius gifuensis TaxID=684658 RepID=A0A834XUH5_APHGI|nr:hypothetical protein HCN44_000826 [Aphidius gifuensis]